MALVHTGGALHQAPGMLSAVFTVPATGTYWADGESDNGTVSLINAATGAVITVCPGSVQLTAGTQVQFKGNIAANARGASGRLIPYNGAGGER